MSTLEYKIERQPSEIVPYLGSIQSLADLERNALSFWPKQQLVQAIARGRLWALSQGGTLAGFLIYSGIFPHAKIQAIATTNSKRKSGAAACLMRSFISEMEQQGFISIKAEVASDLKGALAFYSSLGFEQVSIKQGGKSRNRTIIVHTRELETDTLFSIANKTNSKIELGVNRRSVSEAHFYVFDLNVYFDLAKDRAQSENAGKLFSAALDHHVRLAVSAEFVEELKRNAAKAPTNDPVLKLALRLPKIPAAEKSKLETLSAKIHQIVFGKPPNDMSSTAQSKSDAKHLAHATLAQASAFVTRDLALLAARERLLQIGGIDVINLEELIELLPNQLDPKESSTTTIGEGFNVAKASDTELQSYLKDNQLDEDIIEEFGAIDTRFFDTHKIAISIPERIAAIGVLKIPHKMDPTARLFVHILPENPNCELFCDHILNTLTRKACDKLPTTISLAHIPGQSVVRSIAKSKGYLNSSTTRDLTKISLGRPLTEDNWLPLTTSLRRRTGLKLPSDSPKSSSSPLIVSNSQNTDYQLYPNELEDILNPALIICPDRKAAIVSIRRHFADDLLGTSEQNRFDFIENMDASFKSIRCFINSPRFASILRPERPIFFYESKKHYGRGAVVALARIVDSVIVHKSDIPGNQLKRTVVEDVSDFSATNEVLLTTFDNLFQLPHPVSLLKLKDIEADKGANFISPVTISYKQTKRILNWGWNDECK